MHLSGGQGGVGSGPPTPGVQPPYPRPFFLPIPAPFFIIFFGYPPPKIQIFYSRPRSSDPCLRPLFVKSPPPHPVTSGPLPPVFPHIVCETGGHFVPGEMS